MKNPLDIASKILLTPADLTVKDLEQTLHLVFGSSKIDSADIYLQYLQCESWGIEDSIIKSGNFSIDQGFGMRALAEDKTGFAYSDNINLAALRKTAITTRGIAQSGRSGKIKLSNKIGFNLGLYPAINPLLSLGEDEKVNLLQHIDREARKQDPRVMQVIAHLSGTYEVVLLLSSDGGLAADVRPLTRLDITVIVAEHNKREQGCFHGGGRCDYKKFIESDFALVGAREAVRLGLLNLQAQPAPVGTMPVILGAGCPAVLLHEAIGHGLEGDFIRKKSSVYTGRIGEKVAASGCTIVDQGNLPGLRRGSIHLDDEGTPSQCTVLIENGILCNYMQDKLSARLLGMATTGNARRESYEYAPLPRMTNTFMLSGTHDRTEMIASVAKGLYAVNFSGGQVDITSGEFVFTTSEAYLIEHGKITAPVKHATLIGNGPKILHKIAMIGNDATMDDGTGVCGKDGQSVPVGVGQPTLKVDELVVGGGI